MDKENRTCIDCACLIHGDLYNWEYVEKLHSMLQRNLNSEVKLHVYTEHDRPVPGSMIKHCLIDWPEANQHKKRWWYKIQLFNQELFSGDIIYFDLDIVIIDKLDWMLDLPTDILWAVRDFKYLQNENLYQINSSVLKLNVSKFNWVWEKFKSSNIAEEIKSYHGDQDYIEYVVAQNQRQYFPDQKITSWRWQAQNNIIDSQTSVLVFHGQPKPHELTDNVVIKQHWC